MGREREKIIIVGGGIGGMTAALALAKRNIPSTVLEQAPRFRETGAGIQLCPNVFKMFHHLGILEPMLEIAQFPDNLVYIDGITGNHFLRVSLKEDLISRFNYPYGVFHREELLRSLVKECQKSQLIQLKTDAKVVDIRQTGDAVIVQTEKGFEQQGEALIGCDGLWSVVREHIVGKERPRFSGHVAHRGVVELKDIPERLRPNNVVHWVRDDAHLVHYPIGKEKRFNIIAIYNTFRNYESDDDIEGEPEDLHLRFKGSQTEILELLERINTSRKWMLFDRDPLKNWSLGRATLLGDAAHPTLPYLTQGAGMAIEDACILAQKIYNHDSDYQAAFKAYQEERYLRTAYVQLFSRAYGDTHHSTGVARELRNHLISSRTPEENYEWLGKLYHGIEIK